MVNQRREFFNVTLDEIKEVVKKNFDKTVEFVDVPDAESNIAFSQKCVPEMQRNCIAKNKKTARYYAYRTALHRCSLPGCPKRYNHPEQNELYHLCGTLARVIFAPNLPFATSQQRGEMIYGTVKNKKARINLAYWL